MYLLVSYKSNWERQLFFIANIRALITYNWLQLIFFYFLSYVPHNQRLANSNDSILCPGTGVLCIFLAMFEMLSKNRVT